MSWESKVIWSEGLFLQPHHFQQNDRYLESQIAGISRGAAPYIWGLRELTIDDELLRLGKFAIKSCDGITPDGTSFRIPAVDDLPPAMEIPDTVKESVVFLAIPTRRHGAVEVELEFHENSASRYQPSEVDVTNAVGRDRKPTTIGVGKLRLQFALDLDDLEDQLVIPIAKVIEVRSDGEILLDRSFIPTVLDQRAAKPLTEFLREIEGLLGHRCDALSGRLSDSGPAKGVAELSDYLLLITVNRYLPQIRHLGLVENTHPCSLYMMLLGMAGELATFMATEKRPPEFPPYQHDNLTGTFQPLIRTLRQYLSAVLEQTAVAIPLQARKYGVSVGVIADKRLLTGTQMVLACKAETAAENIRRHMPTQAKLGPVEDIRQLVNSALPGIGLRPLPVAPRQIPYHAGVVYFELDPDSEYWKKMRTSGGLAVHVAGEFPGLEMELWAIRNG
ncbi:MULTISPECIES: type VI secretion system baseplate subunit TssK [Rhodobacterales]|uniref:type VI secretion system baseplate subunit TssK n=1 Tax=Roseobacter sp. N2S TaxID=2663844 RepID=UPI002865ABBF|nr:MULTISPECIES: type VI secretion system baseplate subunit TssK [Rhodobacterales]MDR6265560.1 type VI secretion system protein ImpJ [Roseobacter sp. N2S]